MSHKRFRWLWIAVLFALSSTLALAKGPADKITISGPGLLGTIEIIEPKVLELLPLFAPADIEFNSRNGISEPNVGEGYEIVRYFRQGSTLRAIDMAHYYPNPNGGGGYVFYDGLIDPGMSSEFDGKWYPATPEGDVVMQQILVQHGVSLLPDTGGASPPGGLLFVIAGCLTLIGSILRHRSIHRRSWPN